MIRPVLFWRNRAKSVAGAWELETAQGSFGRLWRVFMNARVAIAAVLAVLQQALQALGTPLNDWTLAVCIAYLGATLAVRLWAYPRPPARTFDGLWVLTIGVDVMAFGRPRSSLLRARSRNSVAGRACFASTPKRNLRS